MLEIGKNVFRVNITQLFAIIFCFGLAILAKYFSLTTANMSLSMFISTTFENIFSGNASYSLWLNVLLPSILYILSSVLLLWMATINFLTLNTEATRIDILLKALLGVSQLILFGFFVFIGGKLILELILFSIILLILVGLIITLFSSNSRNA